jgi:hypothetical protein
MEKPLGPTSLLRCHLDYREIPIGDPSHELDEVKIILGPMNPQQHIGPGNSVGQEETASIVYITDPHENFSQIGH